MSVMTVENACFLLIRYAPDQQQDYLELQADVDRVVSDKSFAKDIVFDFSGCHRMFSAEISIIMVALRKTRTIAKQLCLIATSDIFHKLLDLKLDKVSGLNIYQEGVLYQKEQPGSLRISLESDSEQEANCRPCSEAI